MKKAMTQFGCEDIAGCTRTVRLFVFTLLAAAVGALQFADKVAAAGAGGPQDTYVANAEGGDGPQTSEPIQADSFQAAGNEASGQLEVLDDIGIANDEHVTSVTDQTTGETQPYRANSE